jgi:hypothetical protein
MPGRFSPNGENSPVDLKQDRFLYALKRFLSIFRYRIFDSSVDRGMPNMAAAPAVFKSSFRETGALNFPDRA